MKYILTIFICLLCTLSSFANGNRDVSDGVMENNARSGVNPPIRLVDTDKLKDEINAIIKKKFPDAELVSFKQTAKNGAVIYDCDVSYQNNTVKLYINPQNGAISGKIDNKDLSDEKITKTVINKGTKEVNNVLKQIKLDASFSDVRYNRKDKTLEGNILYMDGRYYFKMNAATGEIIEMRALD